MKKLILLVLMLTMFSTQSQAGLAMIGTGMVIEKYSSDDMGGKGTAIVLGGVGGGVLGSVIGGLAMIVAPDTGLKIMCASIVLDIDEGKHEESLENELNHKYPFINNQLVLKNFSKQLLQRYSLIRGENKSAYVVLDENEIRQAFASADLSEELLLILITDFR